MFSTLKISVVCVLLFNFSNSLFCQIHDSVPVIGNLVTPIVSYDTPEGAYLAYGNDKMVKKTFKITNVGVSEEKDRVFESQSLLLKEIEDLRRKDKNKGYEDITFYQGRYKGTAARGYIYESKRDNLITQDGTEEAEYPVPLEVAENEFFYKRLSENILYNGSKYSFLVTGRKIKKDKTRKNNEYKDFEVFIYNGKLLKTFTTSIKLEWGVICNTVGVVTDEKGEHKGFYIEFDLGGSADGLGKLNADAPKNTKFISFLDLRGKLIRTVQFVMPLRMGTFTYSEFFVHNVTSIGEKLNIYVKTRDMKFGTKVSDWVPGYIHYKEEEGNQASLVSNPRWEDKGKSVSSFTSIPPRALDLSDRVILKNGDLFSFGSSDGENFAYLKTTPLGEVAQFGYFKTTYDVPEGAPFEYYIQEVDANLVCIVASVKVSSSSFAQPFTVKNNFIFVDLVSGQVTPIKPDKLTSSVSLMVTSRSLLSYGRGVKNPNTIHLAYSPNHLDLLLKMK